jgi:hypothetical protein
MTERHSSFTTLHIDLEELKGTEGPKMRNGEKTTERSLDGDKPSSSSQHISEFTILPIRQIFKCKSMSDLDVSNFGAC